VSSEVEGVGDGRCFLFRKLSEMLGLRFTPATHQAFQNSQVFNYHSPLDLTDLIEMQVVVKQMNISL
jgi:hypothetical protein